MKEKPSSNVNEAIRAILNFFIFLQEDFTHTKSIKSIKSTKSTKKHKTQTSDFLLLDVFYAHKKHKKHKKHKTPNKRLSSS